MFTPSIKSICNSFTSKIEKASKAHQKIAKKAEANVKEHQAKLDVANEEIAAAATALVNVRTMFGLEHKSDVK